MYMVLFFNFIYSHSIEETKAIDVFLSQQFLYITDVITISEKIKEHSYK